MGLKMKKYALAATMLTVICAPALAADVAPAPVMDWTGFYVGAFAGGGWGDTDIEGKRRDHGGEDLVEFPILGSVEEEEGGHGGSGGPQLDLNADVDGFLGGLQAGYDFQHDAFLFGVVGDFAFSGISGSADRSTGGHGGNGGDEGMEPTSHEGGQKGPAASFDMDYNWIATLRARAGFLPTENWLIYATGGVAWAGIDFEGTVTGNEKHNYSNDETDVGYALGGGTEYRFNESWSLFAEALYMDFGDDELDADKGPWKTIEYDTDIWIVKGGVNFRLN